MSVWVDVARVAAAANLVLLLALGSVWWRGYRRHGAAHTLGLLIFAAFLLVENALWLYFYLVDPAFIGWYDATTGAIQVGMAALCVLELVALLALVRITWQ